MKVCDGIITDYSAASLRASLLDKPVYLYLYDYENYQADQGLNIDLWAELPRAAFRDPEALAGRWRQRNTIRRPWRPIGKNTSRPETGITRKRLRRFCWTRFPAGCGERENLRRYKTWRGSVRIPSNSGSRRGCTVLSRFVPGPESGAEPALPLSGPDLPAGLRGVSTTPT